MQEKLLGVFSQIYANIALYINHTLSTLSQTWQEFDGYAFMKIIFVTMLAYFLAKIFSKYIPKGLKSFSQKINLPIGDGIVNILRTFIFQILFFTGLAVVVSMLELDQEINFIATSIIKSILFISFIIFGFKLIKILLNKMASSELDSNEVNVIQPATLPLFENILMILFAIGGMYQVFSIWNVDMTALLASAGIAGVTIGMASRDALSDVIAGILILTDAPYQVGDTIYVHEGIRGVVKQIGIRNTRLITADNREIIVPNSIIGTSEIINESSSKEQGLRIELDISVAHGENSDKVKELLLNIAENSSHINQNKEIEVQMISFQKEFINFKMFCWIDIPDNKGITLGYLNEKIYNTFLERDINVAVTQTREISITQMALAQHEIAITKFPDTNKNITIKEMPNIFGNGKIKTISKIPKEAS